MEEEFNLNIFPNPTYDSFTLEFISNGIIDVNVTNLLGEKILSYKLNTNGNHTMIFWIYLPIPKVSITYS